MGFRRFMFRGVTKGRTEWDLACAALKPAPAAGAAERRPGTVTRDGGAAVRGGGGRGGGGGGGPRGGRGGRGGRGSREAPVPWAPNRGGGGAPASPHPSLGSCS